MFIELSIFNEISACIHTFTSLLFIIENLRPICLKQRNNYSISFIFLSCLGIHSSSIFFLFKFLLLLLFCRQAGPFGLLGIKPCVGCNRISFNWKRQSSITGTRPRQVSQYAEKGRYINIFVPDALYFSHSYILPPLNNYKIIFFFFFSSILLQSQPHPLPSLSSHFLQTTSFVFLFPNRSHYGHLKRQISPWFHR